MKRLDIAYLQRHQIDDAKWNACIAQAANGLVYGYTFYLDAMCTHWDALVLPNYEAVFPLPWRKKGFIKYGYQPFAVAQLGLFGSNKNVEQLHGVLKKIPTTFWYLDFPLNFSNRFLPISFPLYERKNYVLDLELSYETIRKNYRTHLKRNIRKATALGCDVQLNVPVETLINLAQKHPKNTASRNDFVRFKNLYRLLAQKKMATIYSVVSKTGEILAAALFFFSNGRAYYILAGNTAEGRKQGASHYLIDTFIKDHAGQKLLLDFEGSDVPALQFFYSSFGAIEQPYVAVRHNRLPRILRWLK